MPVTLHCNQLFQNRRNLYQFLLHCQQNSCEKRHAQIASISLEIDPVDPLVVLNEIAQSDQLSFYFEKQDIATKDAAKNQRLAIAALDSAIQFHAYGSKRFTQIRQFIQTTLDNVIMTGDLHHLFAGPHFFCSFSFAEHLSTQALGGFPPATVFLPKWQISCYQSSCVVVLNQSIDATSDLDQIADSLWQTVQTIQTLQHKFPITPIQLTATLQKQDVASTEQFKQSVEASLRSIQANYFNKIVLAHAVDVASSVPFERAYSLNNLRRMYPDCYIFSVGNGKGQYFMGASPERLVCLRDRQLITDALAGSAPRGQTAQEDTRFANALLCSMKEMHEHQVVLDFISGQLTHLGLNPQASPLRLLQLSNIQHLHTPIRATVPNSVHLLDIVAALHPTPAVAGMPRDLACAQIQEYEPFERSLYAAPIGWVNHKGDGEFAVGIRSALIHGNHARLFAGAGIVAGSDPERELAEVQLKLGALLQALV